MATEIKFKRSSTQNDLPAVSDLALGEIAINTYHGRVYTEKNDGSAAIVEVGSVPASLTILNYRWLRKLKFLNRRWYRFISFHIFNYR